MKRFLVLTVGLLVGCAALAQTPAPESTNNNSNSPAVSVPAATPPSPANKGTADQENSPAATPSQNGAPASQPAAGQKPQPPALSDQQPSQPTTEMLPQGAATGSADPLLEPKELPKQSLSLIGGIATKVDPIRNRVELQPFGGGKKVAVRFDERSHVYRDGRETTVMGIHKGDRVYVDTMLLDGKIFAKNLRVATKTEAAEARGQVTAVDPRTNEITMLDNLTGQNVHFQVTPRTAIQRRGDASTAADLKPGALLDVMFAPGQKGGTAQQVLVLAVPGESFVFAGRVTHIDMSQGSVAIENESDDKNYTVFFNPAGVEDREHLTLGSQVTARATFDGRNYHAQQLTLMSPASAQQ
jgi:predicted RNA-binding protein